MSGSNDDKAQSSSPVCYAEQADDSYMGFASREELLVALNELLAAKGDEAHWCAVLTEAIVKLQGTPSSRIAAFQEKAQPELPAFLNRDQAWVVNRLRELLPKVRDDSLHHTLSTMLSAHERNIGRVDSNLQR
jgi:hypothetical protein